MRQQCMESFEKFAAMAPEERNQFLQNAAKWEAMTAHERQLWRRLVGELPPMPPGMPAMPPGMPPMPPGFVLKWPARPSPATNALAASAGKSP